MKESSMLHRILVKVGIKKPIDYNSIEYLRSRGVQIGDNVHILNSLIDFDHGFLVSIGNNVTLGLSNVGRFTIGDELFIGQGAIVLPNTHIGSRVVIGAGAVVSRDIPDNSVAVGNPIQIIGTYDDFVERHRKQMLERPVYHTLWSEKTLDEKDRMRNELVDGIGYDP